MIEKIEYKSVVDKISFTGEKPITKSYILETTKPAMSKPVPKPIAAATRKATEARAIRFQPRGETSAIPPRPRFETTIQPEDPKGMLVVTSQPLNADVYLNRENVPRGTTPLVLSLD